MTLTEFQSALSAALSDELRESLPRFAREQLRAFDLGCFPWNAQLELSFLTTQEAPVVVEHPFEEIASWRHYHFTQTANATWPRGQELLAWLETPGTRPSNEELWRACADALNSQSVQRALADYPPAPDFLCTVFDPDAAEAINFCTGQPIGGSKRARR